MKPWMQLHSGAPFDLLTPEAKAIRIDDLIRSICRLPRYLAHTLGEHTWTVGEHCLLVADILAHLGAPPLIQIGGLVHDLPEGIYGDWPSPVSAALRQLGAGEALASLRHAVDVAVIEALAVDGVDIEHPLVKRADLIALAIEKRDLMAPCERDWELPEYAMAWSRLAPDPEKDDIERRYKRRLNDLVTSLSETRT